MDSARLAAEDRLKDGRVGHTRVLLIGRRLLRDLVEQLLSAEPDIEIVGSDELGSTLVAAADATSATLVILADGEGELGDACVKLLRARPRLRAMAIVNDGREGWLYELRPHRELVCEGELSRERLVTAVRAARAGVA